MAELLISTLIISVLHALIPSHWMPLITIGKIFKWSHAKTLKSTLYLALAHCSSTILLGLIIGLAGNYFVEHIELFAELIAPVILVLMGIWFLIRHHKHKHFHLHLDESLSFASERKIMFTVLITMFLSPCLEIEAVFVGASTQGWFLVFMVALVYLVVTTIGMMVWMWIALKGIKHLNSHKIEHSAGLISGIVLIATGIISYLIH